MSKLVRYYSEGQIYFVTSVTYNREPFLKDTYDHLLAAFNDVSRDTGCLIQAYALLPDHFHALIDPRKTDLSTIIKRIKLKYSYKYREDKKLYRKTLWQRRFWDHIIRDQNDLNQHLDYIHYNPVKHGYVTMPSNWHHTSFADFRGRGIYPNDWGVIPPKNLDGDFGE